MGNRAECSIAGLQNRYPLNQWQEILGNCDVQLFLGCTDPLTADYRLMPMDEVLRMKK